jgi:hypothetical protein
MEGFEEYYEPEEGYYEPDEEGYIYPDDHSKYCHGSEIFNNYKDFQNWLNIFKSSDYFESDEIEREIEIAPKLYVKLRYEDLDPDDFL